MITNMKLEYLLGVRDESIFFNKEVQMKNKWLIHVKATIRKHPNKPLKDVLKIAKRTYHR
jgi:hypothetical protein